ncbi:acyl-CoA dehydrogenase family protein [Gordonia sp. zg691]|uniref:Acyl-CoA dehydrogenase family protein n=1 Tax=Gordonia jinghuaiqii TaxID=2758710 RepID=A0A7D7LUV6_9ACTN|nr:acyl-CoA dehydrogenase family protein [Gordonia jinghuaiqii]MBD0863553.1 acyl-CoA dehydrogenase family protein [Gordonia jinghuaiqii]MCR5979289.1 acyl-CoA dehydrogenase [Gordonia jinghuaiqii]QMT01075.1 acyl-CoA dehydrogenase family protein [Gordonia jinghuaiqii]
MRLGQDPELDDLRSRVRELCAGNAPRRPHKAGVRAPEASEIPALREWTAELYGRALLGVTWPVEYGGLPDPHPRHEAVVSEELARAGAPMPVGGGLLAASAIIDFGTEAQKAFFLPRIRSGEHIWCQLFSEPGAGSDLAGLHTRARREGDHFVVDGQKVWTTNGHHADWGYLLARTDPEAPKHKGITAFAIDMKSPGVQVRPLREITGTADFNEIFLDGVEVPVDNVIGEENKGWMVTTSSLARERSSAGGGVTLFRALDDLVDLVSSTTRDDARLIDRGEVRREVGRLAAAVQVNALLSAYGESRAVAGTGDAADAALSKIFFGETNLALAEYGMSVQAGDSVRVEGDPAALADGWWQDAFLYARAFTIAGGTNEVLRNLVAERGLGLPR